MNERQKIKTSFYFSKIILFTYSCIYLFVSFILVLHTLGVILSTEEDEILSELPRFLELSV